MGYHTTHLSATGTCTGSVRLQHALSLLRVHLGQERKVQHGASHFLPLQENPPTVWQNNINKV
jgi:hypothetical protein